METRGEAERVGYTGDRVGRGRRPAGGEEKEKAMVISGGRGKMNE
jgi:hypothetical protein